MSKPRKRYDYDPPFDWLAALDRAEWYVKGTKAGTRRVDANTRIRKLLRDLVWEVVFACDDNTNAFFGNTQKFAATLAKRLVP